MTLDTEQRIETTPAAETSAKPSPDFEGDRDDRLFQTVDELTAGMAPRLAPGIGSCMRWSR
jgi:hypothetical protein